MPFQRRLLILIALFYFRMDENKARENFPVNLLDVSLIQWCFRNDFIRELRLYCYVRELAYNNGGYFDLDRAFALEACKALNISRPTFYRHLRSLKTIGWLRKKRGKYHFISIKRIKHKLDLKSRACVEIGMSHICGSYMKFKAYLAVAYSSNNIRCYNYWKRSSETLCLRSKERIKQPTLNSCDWRDLRRKGLFALSLYEKHLGISIAEASQLRRLAQKFGYVRLTRQYRKDIRPIEKDGVEAFKKACSEWNRRIHFVTGEDNKEWGYIEDTTLQYSFLHTKSRSKGKQPFQRTTKRVTNSVYIESRLSPINTPF